MYIAVSEHRSARPTSIRPSRSSALKMLIASMRTRSDFEVGLDLAKPFTEEGAFDVVVDEHEGLFVGLGGLCPLVQLAQEIGTGGAEVAVRRQRRIDEQRRQRIQAGLRPIAQSDRDTTVELDYRRGPKLEQDVVQRDNLRPVGVLPRGRLGVDRSDRSLDGVPCRWLPAQGVGEQADTLA